MANEVDVASLKEYEKVVSMTFSSQEEAYEFYNDYAKTKGFSIRKSIIRKDPKNGTITFRRFYCSKSGFREKKYLDKPHRKRAAPTLSRCGCLVKLCIKLDPNIDRWWVTDYVDVHNHSLAASDTTFYNLKKSAASNYTRKVFAIVREEIEKSNEFVVIQKLESNAYSKYILAPKGKLESRVDVGCFVSEGNIEKLTCTCYKFECEKIPCSHMFAVLIHLDVTFIPQCCNDERLTKTAKSLFSSNMKGGDVEVSDQVQMYHELTKLSKQICYQASKSSTEYVKTKVLLKEEQRRLNDIEKEIEKSKVEKEVVSSNKKSPKKIGNQKPVVTQGAPKKKKCERMESSIEGRRKNKCGNYSMLGHNRQTCQLLSSENDVASIYIEKLSELS